MADIPEERQRHNHKPFTSLTITITIKQFTGTDYFRKILRQIIKEHEIKRYIREEIQSNLHIYDHKRCAFRNIESFVN